MSSGQLPEHRSLVDEYTLQWMPLHPRVQAAFVFLNDILLSRKKPEAVPFLELSVRLSILRSRLATGKLPVESVESLQFLELELQETCESGDVHPKGIPPGAGVAY